MCTKLLVFISWAQNQTHFLPSELVAEPGYYKHSLSTSLKLYWVCCASVWHRQ